MFSWEFHYAVTPWKEKKDFIIYNSTRSHTVIHYLVVQIFAARHHRHHHHHQTTHRHINATCLSARMLIVPAYLYVCVYLLGIYICAYEWSLFIKINTFKCYWGIPAHLKLFPYTNTYLKQYPFSYPYIIYL